MARHGIGWAALATVMAGCAAAPSDVGPLGNDGIVPDVDAPAMGIRPDTAPADEDVVDPAVVPREPPERPDIGVVGEQWCADYDEDGFADPLDCVRLLPRETAPVGHIRGVPPWDCLDTEATTRPGAAERESESACMADHDDDGYGYDAPSRPEIVPGIDCDDYDDAVFLGSAEHEPALCAADRDGDGFGAPDKVETSWWLDVGTDCDDANPGAYPGAAQKELQEPDACKSDADDDGYGDDWADIPWNQWNELEKTGLRRGLDCDDTDPDAYPGAAEVDLGSLTCSRDADLDGYGDGEPAHPDVVSGSDCDDDDAAVTTCPTWCLDSNGDGLGEDPCIQVLPGQTPPEGGVLLTPYCLDQSSKLTACPLWCYDADGDGLGGYPCSEVPPGKAPPPGTVSNDDDCDDDSSSCICIEIGPNFGGYSEDYVVCTTDNDGDGYPGRPKGYDAIGTQGFDCNDYSDCTHYGAAEKETDSSCMEDCDGDGYGDWQGKSAALGGSTWKAAGTDCDDSSATTFVGAAENEPTGPGGCRRDDDGDGYGDLFVPPDGLILPGTDCNDDDPAVFPTQNADGTWTCGP